MHHSMRRTLRLTAAFLFAALLHATARGQIFAPPSPLANLGSSAFAVETADLNADGLQDLVVTTYPNSVLALIATGPSSFSSPSSFAVGDAPYDLTVGDFNGDAKADVAAVSYSLNKVFVLQGDGFGGFAPAASYSVGTNPYRLSGADLNADGRAD